MHLSPHAIRLPPAPPPPQKKTSYLCQFQDPPLAAVTTPRRDNVSGEWVLTVFSSHM